MAARFQGALTSALLSPQGKALADGDAAAVAELEANVEKAELLLGLLALPVPVEPASEDPRAVLAVVEQVNFQIKLGPGAGALGSESKGDQAVVYARGPFDGKVHPVSPTAQMMADVVLREAEEAARRPAVVHQGPPQSNSLVIGW